MKTGFIGLGIMGKPMCGNLKKAGFDLLVYDISPEAAAFARDSALAVAPSVSELARTCGVIILMLPDGPQVEELLLREEGVLAHAAPGTLIIDMSSIAPAVSIRCAEAARQKGVRMIDAPVSGGEPKAAEGTLAIMCGGAPEDYKDALPYFEVLGSSSVLVGAPGSGNITKLCNQMIVGINIAAVGEALTLAVKAGVDPEAVYKAIRGGLAGSTVLDAKAPMILDRNFAPGFKIDLHIKDLRNALSTAGELQSPAFLTGMVQQFLQNLSSRGEGNNDHGGIARFYESLAAAEIGRPR